MKSRTMLRTGAGVLFALLAIAAQPSAWGQTFTTFDPPGSQGTSPVSINPAGQITGNYFDANFTTHGFLRASDGTLTSFDAPAASHGTFPAFITPQGLIVGTYFDANFITQPFLRTKDGTFSSFATPQLGNFGAAASINSSGAVAGNVQNFNCSNFPCTVVLTSFLRAANGTVKQVNDPVAVQGTQVIGINPAGGIIGVYSDANNVQHGFLEKP